MVFRTEEQGGKLKPANYPCEYTPQNVADVLRCREDIIYFIEKFCKIVHPLRGMVPFKLYDYQKRLLKTYLTNDRVISCLPRQTGKSTTAAAFLLWWACFKDDQMILVASNKHRNAIEIMTRLKFMYEELPWFLKPGHLKYNEATVKFDNGSMIEAQATTPTTGRGLSISVLYSDELAYVAPGIQSDMITSVQPTLSSGGKWIITSTPNTDEDRFAQIWFHAESAETSDPWETPMEVVQTGADDYETIYEMAEDEAEFYREADDPSLKQIEGFKRFFVHWMAHPDRDEKFKELQLKSGMNINEWRREFECEFISGEETLISPAKLLDLNLVVRKPRLVDKWGCRWWEPVKPNVAYGIVLDPSEGTGSDKSVIQVWSVPDLHQVAEWASNNADGVDQTKMLIRICKKIYDAQYNNPMHTGEPNIYYSFEKNGVGVSILTSILTEGEERIPGYLIDSSGNKSRGLVTTNHTKTTYAVELKKLIERDRFKPRSRLLVSELKTFIRRHTFMGRATYAGKIGSQDDCVMSCVLMLHLIEELKFHEDGVEEAVHIRMTDYDPDDESHSDNQPLGVFF